MSPPSTPDLPHVRRVLRLAYAGSVTALTGVQLIAPALPAIKRELDLTDPQVGLVTSLFLLPGVVLTMPIGLLTDRFGRRVVFCGALVLMGAGGAVLLLVHDVVVFFGVRLVQGVAFAALLPTTITLIGDVARDRGQVRAQGRRNLAMATGDTVLPLIGGALVAVAWFAPFAVQLVAIPLAIAGWKIIGPITTRHRSRPSLRSLGRLLRSTLALAIQFGGLLRFLFTFALLSYLPILLDRQGASTFLVSVSVSAIAAAGIVSAWVAPVIVSRIKPSVIVAAALIVMGLAMATTALAPSAAVAIPAMLLYGFGSVLFGVIMNAAMVTAVSDDERASFVAAVATVRNFGKFAAPTAIGVLLLSMSLQNAFLLLSGVALVASTIALPYRAVDDALQDRLPRSAGSSS